MNTSICGSIFRRRMCRITPEELLALAKEYGYELPPEQLEAIACGWRITKCHLYNPDCGTFGVPV